MSHRGCPASTWHRHRARGPCVITIARASLAGPVQSQAWHGSTGRALGVGALLAMCAFQRRYPERNEHPGVLADAMVVALSWFQVLILLGGPAARG